MRSTRRTIAGLVAVAALATVNSLAFAQPQGPFRGADAGNCAERGGSHGHGMMGHGSRSHHGGFGPAMWSNPAAAVEGHLAALKVELKITPDQDKAWQAFAATAKSQADTMIARHAQMSAQTPANQTAPDRLAQRTALAKQGIAGMEAMTAAVKDLYGVLTPEQKTLADKQLARGPMGGFGGHRHRS